MSSYGEMKIAEILDELGLHYEREYTFPDLVASSGRNLRFDFAIFDDEGNIETLLEYDGEQHYMVDGRKGNKGLIQQRYNDNQKNQYCQAHGYRLIRIPYWQYTNINKENLLAALGIE